MTCVENKGAGMRILHLSAADSGAGVERMQVNQFGLGD
jgi:hypothetical protein